MRMQGLAVVLVIILLLPVKSFAFIENIGTAFIENHGQTDKNIAYYSRIANGSISVTPHADLLLEFSSITPLKGDSAHITIKEQWRNNNAAKIIAGNSLKTRVNYFIGQNRDDWYHNLETYQSVFIQSATLKVDLELQLRNNSVEKIFRVKPGGDPANLWMDVTGAKLALVSDGRLALSSQTGKTIYFSRPVAFQTINGQKKSVKVAYRVKGNSYGFETGQFDQSKTLVIDPLIQSTYLGGARNDYINDIAVDPSTSEVYVAGSTSSIIPGGPLSIRKGEDAFIARLSSDLKTVLSLSYIAGSGTDRIKAISFGLVPGGSDIYVAGSTSSADLAGISDTSAKKQLLGSEDAFIAVLTPDLSTLTNSSYFGGSSVCGSALSATTDVSALLFGDNGSQDVLYMAGKTSSSSLPGTSSFPTAQSVCAGGLRDGYITMFSRDLSSVITSTYLGGSGNDNIVGLVQAIGRIFVAGDTDSDDIPGVDEGSAQWDRSEPRNGNEDSFISRLESDLTAIQRSTYFGGTGIDTSSQLIFTGASLYLGGNTTSVDLPNTSGALIETPNDMFVARIATQLETDDFIKVTYLGGSGADNLQDLTFDDSSDDIYVVGGTSSDDLPAITNAAQEQLSGVKDAFVMRLNGFLSSTLGIANPMQTTYLGGPNSPEEIATTVATSKIFDPFAVYVAGLTTSDSFPETTGGAQSYRDGGLNDYMEGFVSVFDASLTIPEIEPEPELPIGTIGIDNESIDFQAAGVDTTKILDFRVFLHSRSGHTLTINDIQVDSDEGIFGLEMGTGSCDEIPFTLDEFLWTCHFNLTFSPQEAIEYSANLIVSSNDPENGEVTIALMGRGVVGPKIQVDPTEHSYGTVHLDYGSTLQYFKVANVGSADLTISSIVLTETAGSGNFQLNTSTTCSLEEAFVLQNGEFCYIDIAFDPDSVGNFSANVEIESDDIEETVTIISLQGRGRRRDTICFIATAAFGSPMQKDVVLLRRFRDQYLLTNSMGKAFVEFYYETSPPIAKVIADNELLRALTRGLLQPLILSIKYPLVFFTILFAIMFFILGKRINRTT